jgi:polynucleotide 5'-hydroxyl-kinase GRC3/NOL9
VYLAVCHEPYGRENVSKNDHGSGMSFGMRYFLGSNNTLIVRGPASLQLLAGRATALGAPLDSRRLIVPEEKQLPIETSFEADLHIVLGESSSLFEVEGSTIPSSWHSALDAIAEMNQGKIVIVGAADVGKSTLSTFLANGLLKKGIIPRIVDADIGQADIGPPTTVASAVPSSYLSSLVDLAPSAMIFVGHTSPSHVQAKLLRGIRRLSDREQRSLTVINTDGWALDPEAILYKIELIETIHPDLVLGIETGKELEPILSRAGASMRIEAPQLVLARSRSDRRQIRTASYRRYLDGGKEVAYSRRNVRVRLPNALAISPSTRISEQRNLIVGLMDDEGYLLQIGVLLSLEEEMLRVYSRPTDRLSEIELGYVKLSTEGVELGYLEL